MEHNQTTYISVIDKTTEPDKGHFRQVSLGINKNHPKTLELLGGLSHCTEITFDGVGALKLVNWLKENILLGKT